MFFANVDGSTLKPATDSLLQEMCPIWDESNLSRNMHLIMLPGTISNHHLFTSSSERTETSTHTSVANSACLDHPDSTSQVDCRLLTNDTEDFIVNAFRPLFNNARPNNNRNINQRVKFNRSQSGAPFRGTWNACLKPNHHARNCKFLKKLTACLNYMER